MAEMENEKETAQSVMSQLTISVDSDTSKCISGALVPRDDKPVLKQILTVATSLSDPSSSNLQSPSSTVVSAERRGFLQNVMSTLNGEIEIIMRSLEFLKTSTTEKVADEEIIKAFKSMQDAVEYFNLSTDFAKLQGFQIISPYLRSENDEVLFLTLNVIGIACQNHKDCQNYILTVPTIIDDILNVLDSEKSDDRLRRKALFAISGVIQNNEETHACFKSKNGYIFLLKLFIISDKFTKDRACFLICMLCWQYEHVRPYMLELGFLRTLVDYYMSLKVSESKDDVLGALHKFLLYFPSGIRECYNTEAEFVIHLQKLIREPKFINTEVEFEHTHTLFNMMKALRTLENRSN